MVGRALLGITIGGLLLDHMSFIATLVSGAALLTLTSLAA